MQLCGTRIPICHKCLCAMNYKQLRVSEKLRATVRMAVANVEEDNSVTANKQKKMQEEEKNEENKSKLHYRMMHAITLILCRCYLPYICVRLCIFFCRKNSRAVSSFRHNHACECASLVHFVFFYCYFHVCKGKKYMLVSTLSSSVCSILCVVMSSYSLVCRGRMCVHFFFAKCSHFTDLGIVICVCGVGSSILILAFELFLLFFFSFYFIRLCVFSKIAVYDTSCERE